MTLRLQAVEELGKWKSQQSIDILWRLMMNDLVYDVQNAAFLRLQSFGEQVKLPKKAKGNLIKQIEKVDCRLLKVWADDYEKGMVYQIIEEIPAWFKLSGNQQSSNQDDVLIAAASKLSFLTDMSSEFTVEQAKGLIRLLFPTKTKTVYEGSSSYGIKHLFEHVSMSAINSGYRVNKYCSNQTVIEAFEEDGYKWEQDGPNRYMNISPKEINRAKKLFWNT